MKKHLLGVIGGLALSVGATAQQLPVMNHYIYNPYLYNPARTGQNEYGSINVNFKKQWVALPYSPLTAILSAEAPIRGTKIGEMGLGGMFYSDNSHLIDKMGGLVSYAYHVPFQKSKGYRHALSAGLSLGFIHQRLDYNSATVENEADLQVLQNNANGTAFDFSFGLDYQWRDLHVGFSMLQGLNNGLRFINPENSTIKYVNTRHIMMNASYRFRINKPEKHKFYIEPVFLGRVVPNLPFQAEFTTLFGLEGIAWLGFGYRSSNIETSTAALNFTAGGEILRKFIFAYSVEFGTAAGLNASAGTQHEFTLAYRFLTGGNKKLEEKVKQMDEQIAQMKENDALMEKRLNKTEETLTRQQTILDSLRNELTIQSGTQEEMKKKQEELTAQIAAQEAKIKSQQELLDKHETKLDQHDKDIDDLRKAIQKNPLQYKKMGEVFFDSGSSALDKTALSNLEAAKTALAAKNTKIYLYGHASTDGNAKANQELSVKRASAVRQQLITLGIPAERIEMLPFGAENPAGGDASKSESRDRRVEIIISEK